MKVIHLPMEIAGQVSAICNYLNRKNIKATGYNYFQSYFQYDGVIETESYEMTKLIDSFISNYDIFHYHNGHTISDNFEDLELVKESGRKLIMHHRGPDVRSRHKARKGDGYTNPYANADDSLEDSKIHENLLYFSKMMDAAIVQDYELYKYVIDYYKNEGKPVYILPRLIDLTGFQVYLPSLITKKPLIVHAPTQRKFKGTDYIEAVIGDLKTKHHFDYKCIEGKSRKEALQLYKEADIIIDQVLCGAFGNLSVEGMALGKPVVCYIREDMEAKTPDLPIKSANPDTLYTVLEELIKNPKMRRDLGRKGRSYVEKHHEASKVTDKLISIYKEIL